MAGTLAHTLLGASPEAVMKFVYLGGGVIDSGGMSGAINLGIVKAAYISLNPS